MLLLTPWVLLGACVSLWLSHGVRDARLWVFSSWAFAIGFGVEVLGVHTGFPFGHYAYGTVFGVQVWQVPLLIGINWLVLAYATGALAHRLVQAATPWGTVQRAALAATAMTLLDVAIEPVAIALGYWHWYSALPPWQNYAGWWGTAFLLHWGAAAIGVRYTSPLALPLLLAQALYFLLLNGLLRG
jgi:putative membrane protein